MSKRRVVLERVAVFALALAALAIAPVRRASAQQGIAVGAKAPVVAVNDLDGKPVDLGTYIGKKPVLLEFWATWCTLCEEMLPRIKAAHAAYGDRVEFVGINVTVNQTPARVRRYLESHQPPYRTLYDDRGTSIRAYQVPTTSYIVVVDRAGTVAYTGTGGEQDLEPVLKQVTSR
ncbi:MAG TPA: TlpA disulfide reductase family protein [Gemmatimonadales bacterium]|nr:TlpA disulfide reductase family protein [Gemmatimonadales bacterium]